MSNRIRFGNNVTTYEQARRLIEMGLPTWTADFVIVRVPEGGRLLVEPDYVVDDDTVLGYRWGASRLIELWCILRSVDGVWVVHKNAIDSILNDYYFNGDPKLDFSKLYVDE